MWELSFFDDNLWLEKGDVYKAAVICRRMRREAEFCDGVSDCPPTPIIVSCRLDAIPRVACIDRRDSPIIYLLVDGGSNKQQQSRVLSREARRRTGCVGRGRLMKWMFGRFAVRIGRMGEGGIFV